MKKSFSMFVSLGISCFLVNSVSAFTVTQDGDAYNFAKNMPTPTFNILYEKVGISKTDTVFSKTEGSLFEAKIANDANGNQIFGVQLPFSALANHTNMLYTLKKGDNPISGSYSFLFPNSVRDNYGDYYDLRISESNIKIGSAEERGVLSTNYVTLFSVDRVLVSRSIGGTYSARKGLGHQGDFTITIEKDGVPVNGSFIFSARDLDIPDHVSETTTNPNYVGPYSESFQDINNTVSNVYLTNDSTVQVIGENRIVGSSSNEDVTYKSGFAFLANSGQVAHMGISGAATGVPILLERSFSSFEQTSSDGGTIFATSRSDTYDSTSGRLITIPSAADGSNAVIYTMTPNPCNRAKSVTLSVRTAGGSEVVTQIEMANLADSPVENLSFNEETGVLTYVYPNIDDYYYRHTIHVEWEEKENCPIEPIEPIAPTEPTETVDLAATKDEEATINKEVTNWRATPNTGIASNSEDKSSSIETHSWIELIMVLILAIIGFKRMQNKNY